MCKAGANRIRRFANVLLNVLLVVAILLPTILQLGTYTLSEQDIAGAVAEAIAAQDDVKIERIGELTSLRTQFSIIATYDVALHDLGNRIYVAVLQKGQLFSKYNLQYVASTSDVDSVLVTGDDYYRINSYRVRRDKIAPEGGRWDFISILGAIVWFVYVVTLCAVGLRNRKLRKSGEGNPSGSPSPLA